MARQGRTFLVAILHPFNSPGSLNPTGIMLIIASPAKTQRPERNGPELFSLPCFLPETAELITTLNMLNSESLQKLMRLSPTLLRTTRERISSLTTSLSPANSCQALFTFKGDAFGGLTPGQYTPEQLQYGQQRLAILSGLYGILRPLDLMQPHRLEMATRLETTKGQNLYQFWGNSLTTRLNEMAEVTGSTVVVNLASQEYSRAILKKQLTSDLVQVTFKQMSKGELKTVPIHSKRARGLMLHYAITRGIEEVEELRQFTADGYRYDRELSTRDHYFFIQE